MYSHQNFNFILQNILGVFGLFLLISNGNSFPLLNIIFTVFILKNVFGNLKNVFSAAYFYFIILASTLIPLLLFKINYISDIVLSTPGRSSILIPRYYEQAFDLILYSLFIFSTYLNYTTSFSFHVKNVRKKMVLLLEIFILLISYLVNKNSSLIFLGKYSGDGYIEGESFGGWSVLFIGLMAYYIYYTNLKKRRYLLFCILVILFWFLYGNRGEIFPIIFFLVLKFSKSSYKINYKRLLLYGAGSIALFFTAGIVRSNSDFQFTNFVNSFNSQFTGAPVAYTLMTILYHTENFGFSYGSTLVDYFFRTLPSFMVGERPGDISQFLVDRYSSLGGIHFVGEFFFNFGVYGLFFIVHFFGIFITRIEKLSKTFYLYQFLYIILIFTATRTIWYGYITIYKTFILLFIIVGIYFLFKKDLIIRLKKIPS